MSRVGKIAAHVICYSMQRVWQILGQCSSYEGLRALHAFISQKENLKPGVFSVPASTLALMPAELEAFARSSAALSTASVSVFFFRMGTMTT